MPEQILETLCSTDLPKQKGREGQQRWAPHTCDLSMWKAESALLSSRSGLSYRKNGTPRKKVKEIKEEKKEKDFPFLQKDGIQPVSRELTWQWSRS